MFNICYPLSNDRYKLAQSCRSRSSYALICAAPRFVSVGVACWVLLLGRAPITMTITIIILIVIPIIIIIIIMSAWFCFALAPKGASADPPYEPESQAAAEASFALLEQGNYP